MTHGFMRGITSLSFMHQASSSSSSVMPQRRARESEALVYNRCVIVLVDIHATTCRRILRGPLRGTPKRERALPSSHTSFLGVNFWEKKRGCLGNGCRVRAEMISCRPPQSPSFVSSFSTPRMRAVCSITPSTPVLRPRARGGRSCCSPSSRATRREDDGVERPDMAVAASRSARDSLAALDRLVPSPPTLNPASSSAVSSPCDSEPEATTTYLREISVVLEPENIAVVKFPVAHASSRMVQAVIPGVLYACLKPNQLFFTFF